MAKNMNLTEETVTELVDILSMVGLVHSEKYDFRRSLTNRASYGGRGVNCFQFAERFQNMKYFFYTDGNGNLTEVDLYEIIPGHSDFTAEQVADAKARVNALIKA